jgi:hypothetical protein
VAAAGGGRGPARAGPWAPRRAGGTPHLDGLQWHLGGLRGLRRRSDASFLVVCWHVVKARSGLEKCRWWFVAKHYGGVGAELLSLYYTCLLILQIAATLLELFPFAFYFYFFESRFVVRVLNFFFKNSYVFS